MAANVSHFLMLAPPGAADRYVGEPWCVSSTLSPHVNWTTPVSILCPPQLSRTPCLPTVRDRFCQVLRDYPRDAKRAGEYPWR